MESDPDHVTSQQLITHLYEELKTLAAAQLNRERREHTLSPTALVHEVYVRLAASPGRSPQWRNHAHFFGAAAIAMRRVLIEHARRRNAEKRGGGRGRTDGELPLPEDVLEVPNIDLIALDEAMSELEIHSKGAHDVVMYRFFAGLSREQTAEIMVVDVRTVTRHWNAARVWLHDRLSDSRSGATPSDELPDDRSRDE